MSFIEHLYNPFVVYASLADEMYLILSAAVPSFPDRTGWPQNPEIRKFNVVRKRRSTDFKALQLWKGRSGSALSERLTSLPPFPSLTAPAPPRGGKKSQIMTQIKYLEHFLFDYKISLIN